MMTIMSSSLGYGKRTPFGEWPIQGRNGKGVIGHKLSDKTGDIAGAVEVSPDDHLMIVTDTGRVIRFVAETVRLVKSRSSQGVRLMRLEDDERIVDVARIIEDDDDDESVEGIDGSDEDAEDAEDADITADEAPEIDSSDEN
jgi:DNA gyrase subunit A